LSAGTDAQPMAAEAAAASARIDESRTGMGTPSLRTLKSTRVGVTYKS
jgi:hypothetical protein